MNQFSRFFPPPFRNNNTSNDSPPTSPVPEELFRFLLPIATLVNNSWGKKYREKKNANELFYKYIFFA